MNFVCAQVHANAAWTPWVSQWLAENENGMLQKKNSLGRLNFHEFCLFLIAQDEKFEIHKADCEHHIPLYFLQMQSDSWKLCLHIYGHDKLPTVKA